MTIKDLMQQGEHLLKHSSPTPRPDVEILLCHLLNCQRAYLYTYPERQVTSQACTSWQDIIQARAAGQPVAYLTGRQGFMDLDLQVNANVLIPRPETEVLVATALDLLPKQQACQVADLGTGSGAITCALAACRTNWSILAIDNSLPALQVAQTNKTNYELTNILLAQGSWCQPLTTQHFDMIVSNPPYIAADEAELTQGDVRFEPTSALIAEQQGLAAFKAIAKQAYNCLHPSGYLVLEHGYRQSNALTTLLTQFGYTNITKIRDLNNHNRVIVAQTVS